MRVEEADATTAAFNVGYESPSPFTRQYKTPLRETVDARCQEAGSPGPQKLGTSSGQRRLPALAVCDVVTVVVVRKELLFRDEMGKSARPLANHGGLDCPRSSKMFSEKGERHLWIFAKSFQSWKRNVTGSHKP